MTRTGRALIKGLATCALVAAAFLGSSQAATVLNGDFELDKELFGEWPGYIGGGNPAQINSWIKAGGGQVGINPAGPADHGNRTPFGGSSTFNTTTYAFLQGSVSLSQEISGFSVGTSYLVNIDFNARDCCGDQPQGAIYINDTLIASTLQLLGGTGAIPPTAPDQPWYHVEIPFQADAETLTLRIAAAPVAGGDATLVIDNVSVVIPEPSSALLALLAPLTLLLARRRRCG